MAAKITPQIERLEMASTGEEVKEALLDCINRLNIYHSRKFGREAIPDDPSIYDETSDE